MTEVFAVAVITVLAVIAPGADFAMVVRNNYLHGRSTGLLAATGVVAVFFSHDRMRTLMLRGQKVLNKVIGSVLAGLGISLAFAPSH
ncbi:hypothetical protein AQJ23_07380 [Streptomyces antibioticus]|nr:hypothetical protein [Streptomyces antibioticus]KUN28746.1 hypothetical protein AQJ23_07380 [Streptomyces antibioticus]